MQTCSVITDLRSRCARACSGSISMVTVPVVEARVSLVLMDKPKGQRCALALFVNATGCAASNSRTLVRPHACSSGSSLRNFSAERSGLHDAHRCIERGQLTRLRRLFLHAGCVRFSRCMQRTTRPEKSRRWCRRRMSKCPHSSATLEQPNQPPRRGQKDSGREAVDSETENGNHVVKPSELRPVEVMHDAPAALHWRPERQRGNWNRGLGTRADARNGHSPGRRAEQERDQNNQNGECDAMRHDETLPCTP